MFFIASGCDNSINPQTKEEQLKVEFFTITTDTFDTIYIYTKKQK